MLWEKLAEDRIAKHGRLSILIKGCRYRLSLSQEALGKLVGISKSGISRIENGHRPMDFMKARKIADVLGIPYKVIEALIWTENKH